MIVAVFVWYNIPDSPGTAKFLTRRQRKVAQLRLRKEKDVKQEEGQSGLKIKEILQTLVDPKVYVTAVRFSLRRYYSLLTWSCQAMFFSCNVAFSSLPPFLPTIVQQ